MKPMFKVPIILSLGKAKGVEEQTYLDDDCFDSTLEGITIAGGEPGRVEFGTVIITGCSEATTERCTVASTSESATLEHVRGELVYHDSGGGVGILFEPVSYTMKIRCKDEKPCTYTTGDEYITSEFLPHVDSFAYSPLVEDIFSPSFLGYEHESRGTAMEIHNTGEGVVEANRVGYQFSILQELESAPVEDKEVKAE